jgi:hypothetical protein
MAPWRGSQSSQGDRVITPPLSNRAETRFKDLAALASRRPLSSRLLQALSSAYPYVDPALVLLRY